MTRPFYVCVITVALLLLGVASAQATNPSIDNARSATDTMIERDYLSTTDSIPLRRSTQCTQNVGSKTHYHCSYNIPASGCIGIHIVHGTSIVIFTKGTAYVSLAVRDGCVE